VQRQGNQGEKNTGKIRPEKQGLAEGEATEKREYEKFGEYNQVVGGRRDQSSELLVGGVNL